MSPQTRSGFTILLAVGCLFAGAPPTEEPDHRPGHGHGHDATVRHPFDDVDRWVRVFDDPARDEWQKPDEVVSALGLSGDETVVDLGAGSGYFAFRIGQAVPQGKVIAADIEPEMIRYIHHKAMTEGVGNIEARLIKADDPSVPADVDLVFVCDVLHHVSDRPAWLARITKAMPTGAKLALIEFREYYITEVISFRLHIKKCT